MNVRDKDDGPVLVHVITQKGKGYAPAEASDDRYHGVNKFDVATGQQIKPKADAPSYTSVFGKSLVAEAERDEKIVAITAAMPGGTGLDIFGRLSRNALSTSPSPNNTPSLSRRVSPPRAISPLRALFDIPAARL